MKRKYGISASLLGCFSIAGLLVGTGAEAKTYHFNFALSGKQETPPNASKGSGLAKVTYDDKTHELDWIVSYKGLSGDATMAHFHGPAKKGTATGIALWAVPMGAAIISPIVGGATLTDAQAKQLESGLWYFNIHTAALPKGEIRGQVVAAHAMSAAAKPAPAPAPAEVVPPAPRPAAATTPHPAPMPMPMKTPVPVSAPASAPKT
jgi:hypothetical protein